MKQKLINTCRLGLILGILALSARCQGQSYQLGRAVLSPLGSLSQSDSMQLSTTIGEIAINSSEVGSTGPGTAINYLTQGFQQPNDQFAINVSPELSTGIKIFPNPVSDYATLEIRSSKSEIIHLQIVDLRGRKVALRYKAMEVSPGQITSQKLSLQHLAFGQYVIQLLGQEGDILNQLLITRAP